MRPKGLESPVQLAEEFHRHARDAAGAPLVVGDEATCTRRQLAGAAATLIARLAREDIEPGAVVAMAAPNGVPFLTGLLACWQLGVAVLPLDAGEPDPRRRAKAASFGARWLLVAGNAGSAEWCIARVTPEDTPALPPGTAVIKLSSGSTGQPRGIVVPARAVAADTVALEQVMRIDERDRVLAAVPMSFSYGFSSLAVPSILFGRVLVVPRRDNPLGALQAASRFAATVLPTVPAFLQAMVQRGSRWRLPTSLRLVLSAGAPIRGDTARRFRERYNRAVHVFYGASECGGICYDRQGSAAERGTVGTPIPGVGIHLQPPDNLVEVRSPSVASTYLPAAPSELDGSRFVSSDIGRFEGDELRLLGRREELIHVGGHKFSPREVELLLAELAGVEEVVIRDIPDRGCTAFVATARQLTSDRVRQYCTSRLPAYKTPRCIRLVREIPRTSRGKLDLDALDRLARERQTRAGEEARD